jgi:hypothetical protein
MEVMYQPLPSTNKMKTPNRQTVTELTDLPNIGKAIAGDLRLLNIQHPQDLIGKDAYQLYNELCQATAENHDPCVIDVFLLVVDFMNGADAKPWWKYTTERKKHYSHNKIK